MTLIEKIKLGFKQTISCIILVPMAMVVCLLSFGIYILLRSEGKTCQMKDCVDIVNS